MDFAGLLLLGFLWFLFNLMRRNRERSGRLPSRPLPPPAPPSSGDATQREGSRLETLLREFERALDQGARTGPPGRPAGVPLPGAEEVEERETLEQEPVIVSLEEEVRRPVRAPISQDEGAEVFEAARVTTAAARSGALTSADHAAFDARIRQEPADATAVRTLTPEQLRSAVVWREVLGPPVALRQPEP